MLEPIEKESIKVVEKKADVSQIVLYNDDVNTFDWVIESLMDICEHDLIQAEQCTVLVHYKGKCGVKSGSYKKLKPLCTLLLERGLSAEIENNN